MNGVGCAACHAGANLTSASTPRMFHGAEPGDADFIAGDFDLRLERMFMQVLGRPRIKKPLANANLRAYFYLYEL